MREHSFTVEVDARSSPAQLFALLEDGASWSQWAGRRVVGSSWEREGDPPPGGVGAIRRLGWRRLSSREEVVVCEPPHRHDYVVLSGLPCRSYRARVDLRSRADGGTHVVWQATFEPLVPRTAAVLRPVLRATVRGLARRLVRHADALADQR
jgi:hypothetical protein